MSAFRILSLDGGGIRGVFTASVLAELESMTRKKLVDYFDLITGTSTGGVIAVALAIGIPARDILEFYVSHGPTIFPSTGIHRRVGYAIRHAFWPKHSSCTLRAAVTSVLGRHKLGEAQCRLVIPAYDAVAGDIHLFKTAHHERFKTDYQLPAVDVAMATAAAPTYFPAFSTKSGSNCIDGGVWANCPAIVGVVEAIAVLGKKPEEIEVLSIGTTAEPFHVSKPRRRFGGFLLWNKGLIDLLLQAQVAAALAQAKLLTGKRAFRINTVVTRGRFTIDDARQIADLQALGAREARHCEDEVSRRFLDVPAPRFEPRYTLNSSEQPIGRPNETG
jgi:hypothetical protein